MSLTKKPLKHLESVKAVDCENNNNLGTEKYTEKLIDGTPIKKGFK